MLDLLQKSIELVDAVIKPRHEPIPGRGFVEKIDKLADAKPLSETLILLELFSCQVDLEDTSHQVKLFEKSVERSLIILAVELLFDLFLKALDLIEDLLPVDRRVERDKFRIALQVHQVIGLNAEVFGFLEEEIVKLDLPGFLQFEFHKFREEDLQLAL
ncbi:MAG: hypothetical protein ABIJ27_01030 [Candidatus Omnitrophota bacterium]